VNFVDQILGRLFNVCISREFTHADPNRAV
jgi:hypothetical protein